MGDMSDYTRDGCLTMPCRACLSLIVIRGAVRQAGLLSTLEDAGLTLSQAEKLLPACKLHLGLPPNQCVESCGLWVKMCSRDPEQQNM